MNRQQRRSQERASKKQNGTVIRQIHGQAIINALADIANVFIVSNIAQDYGQTPESKAAIINLAAKFKLNRFEFQQLLVIREKFEDELENKYNFTMPKDLAAWTVDIQQLMIDNNVPRTLRIVSGLFDTLIAIVGQKVGAIKVHF